jgi:hypothetical protein
VAKKLARGQARVTREQSKSARGQTRVTRKIYFSARGRTRATHFKKSTRLQILPALKIQLIFLKTFLVFLYFPTKL